MTVILSILKIAFIFGTLITVHELGHFLVAKACNVKVHKFAIGFGPKILTKIKGETEYTLRAIPFGGFVQLEGEDRRSDDERAFNNKPVWQRMLIIIAGATVNIIVALVIYFGIIMNINKYSISTIKKVDVNSVAYESGLRDGDKILAVDGKKTTFATQVEDKISESKNSNVIITVERNNKTKKDIDVIIPEEKVGIIGVAFENDGTVAYVQQNGEAQKAGIMEGDKIISVNGVRGLNITEYTDTIKRNANKEINIVMDRDNNEIEFSIVPQTKTIKKFDVNYVVASNLNIVENTYYAINETGYYFSETIKGFAKLITGKTENVSVMGPVGIAGEISKTNNASDFFYLMSAISLSLGIFNLLPIPGLDGGKFLFLLIELIRRKPIKEKTEISWQLAGFLIIIITAIIITVKDVINLF